MDTVKKAAKHLYFLVQLKRANLPCRDLVLFYTTCIRSVLTYAVPVFHYALPKYLNAEFERIKKSTLTIIYPCVAMYNNALELAGISIITVYNKVICNKMFDSVLNNKNNRPSQVAASIEQSLLFAQT